MTTRLNVVLALFAAVAVPVARAEVSVDRGAMRLQARPGQTWAPMRPEAVTAAVLNPYGDARGDGPPSVAQAPVSGSFEATWALGGSSPGLAFSRYDADAEAWTTVRVPVARSGSRSAGRTVALHHDSEGNAFLLYEDPLTGQVLLSSVARGSLRVNPPMVLATPQRPGTSPDAYWDGEALVVAFVRSDSPDRLEVMGVVPQWDSNGRIPEGGEGIPGIPEPIFGRAAVAGGLGSSGTLATGGSAPGPWSVPLEIDLDQPPPMLRIEPLGGDRLLVSWLHDGWIFWSQRSSGHWSEPVSAELEDALEFEEVRQRLTAALAGRIAPGLVRDWDWGSGRRLPDAFQSPRTRR